MSLFLVVSGRYHPGKDKPDPKTWKANFRCALNSLPDVCELHEHSRKRGNNAFRVYRMMPSMQPRRRRRGDECICKESKPFRLIYTDQLSGDRSEQFILVISLQWLFCPSQGCGCSADLKEDRHVYMMLLKVNSLLGNHVPPEPSQSQCRRMTHPQKTP